jgi:hypothetical protein
MTEKRAPSDREQLVKLLQRHTAAGIGAGLTPEMVIVAIEELRAYAAVRSPNQSYLVSGSDGPHGRPEQV